MMELSTLALIILSVTLVFGAFVTPIVLFIMLMNSPKMQVCSFPFHIFALVFFISSYTSVCIFALSQWRMLCDQ